MQAKFNSLVLVAVIISLVPACTGVSYSYKTKLSGSSDSKVLRINKADVIEVLTIANGFPGWWGVYPSVMSSKPSLASITCKNQRSFIPFKKPGIIFGGEICHLTAHKPGIATLYFGNFYGLSSANYDEKIDVFIHE